MMLADFGEQSSGTSYSMPSSSGTIGGTSQVPGGKQRSSVISAWVTQIRKRKKKRKKKVDQFDLHHYPDRREKSLTYTNDKTHDGNIEWRRRYERYGLSKASSDNRDRSELPEYVSHYTIRR